MDETAEEGTVDLVIVAVMLPFVIVLSSESRPSSTEKPKSSCENMAAVKSPMESSDSPSLSPCPPNVERRMDVLWEEWWRGLDMTLNPD